MRVLLKNGAAAASVDNILVLPQTFTGHRLETLVGEEVEHGFLAEAQEEAVIAEVNRASRARSEEGVSAKQTYKDLKWLNKALAEFEPGSRFGLRFTGRGFTLDHSEAKRINRAEGLAAGDMIAVGPTISPRSLMNARGRVVRVGESEIVAALDPGDRDRIERATGKRLDAHTTLPIGCVEKVG